MSIIFEIENSGKLKNEIVDKMIIEDNSLIIKDNLIIDDTININILECSDFKIELGNNSRIKIILKISNNIFKMNDFKLNFVLKKNSNLDYISIFDFKNRKKIIIDNNFNLEENSKLNSFFISLGKKLFLNVNSYLKGANSNSKIEGIIATNGKNEQKMDINIVHNALNTTGFINMIALSSDCSKSILNGVSKINNGMKNSSSHQKLKGIILGSDALVEINPILLIEEYDVKAGHAASVGKIEEDLLFYIQSRGINKKDANKLILKGFINPIIQNFEENLRYEIEEKIMLRI